MDGMYPVFRDRGPKMPFSRAFEMQDKKTVSPGDGLPARKQQASDPELQVRKTSVPLHYQDSSEIEWARESISETPSLRTFPAHSFIYTSTQELKVNYSGHSGDAPDPLIHVGGAMKVRLSGQTGDSAPPQTPGRSSC